MKYSWLLLVSWMFISLSCMETPSYTASHKLYPVKLQLLPLGRIDSVAVNMLRDSLLPYFNTVNVLSPVRLPDMAYYRPRNRYRADSLLKYLDKIVQPEELLLGVTAKDISACNETFADYGIMGLAYRPGKVAIVSGYRLKKTNRNSQLFKVAIHELGHTRGLKHCSEASCFMRDANGGNPTDQEKAYCQKCLLFLTGLN